MCCFWTMDTAPVCLDLMVGRPMDHEPSRARCTGTRTEANVASSACGRAPSMTNDEVLTRPILPHSVSCIVSMRC